MIRKPADIQSICQIEGNADFEDLILQSILYGLTDRDLLIILRRRETRRETRR